MFDKNGTSIHEGDDVRFYYKGKYVVCEVIYDRVVAMFCLLRPNGY